MIRADKMVEIGMKKGWNGDLLVGRGSKRIKWFEIGLKLGEKRW